MALHGGQVKEFSGRRFSEFKKIIIKKHHFSMKH